MKQKMKMKKRPREMKKGPRSKIKNETEKKGVPKPKKFEFIRKLSI